MRGIETIINNKNNTNNRISPQDLKAIKNFIKGISNSNKNKHVVLSMELSNFLAKNEFSGLLLLLDSKYLSKEEAIFINTIAICSQKDKLSFLYLIEKENTKLLEYDIDNDVIEYFKTLKPVYLRRINTILIILISSVLFLISSKIISLVSLILFAVLTYFFKSDLDKKIFPIILKTYYQLRLIFARR